MEFNSDEKLMLFLIWCIGERGLSIDFHDGFGDEEIWLWINKHGAFREFLSEACESNDEFKLWVNDEILKAMENKGWFIAWEKKTEKCRHKIKITIGD